MFCAYHGYRRAQTLYSTVNNSVFNVMHNRIDSTIFNYLSVATTWCRVAHLFPSNNVLCDVKIFFLFFMCGGHVDSSSFCFTTKVKLYFKKLLKMSNRLYINEILLQVRCCVSPINTTRSGGPVRMGYVAWLSHATSPGATGPGVTVLCRYVTREVTPISVARLGLDLLSQADPWHDWKSCHRVWRNSWNVDQSRQTDWRDWCNAQIANSSLGLTSLSQNNQ
jgi:hypothetical protein